MFISKHLDFDNKNTVRETHIVIWGIFLKGSNMIMCALSMSNSRGCCLAPHVTHKVHERFSWNGCQANSTEFHITHLMLRSGAVACPQWVQAYLHVLHLSTLKLHMRFKIFYGTLSCIVKIMATDDVVTWGARTSGGRLNKKDGLTRYGNSHVKDKTS